VVELDTTAVNNVTGVYFAVPAIAFDDDPNLSATGITNDFVFRNIHCENFNSVGLLQSGQSRLRTPDCKLHGQPSPTDAFSSMAAAWIVRSDGFLSGTLEGREVGAQGKIYAAALAGQMKIGAMDMVIPYNAKVATERDNGADGLLSFIDGLNILNQINVLTRQNFFDNEVVTTPKIFVEGPVTCFGLSPTGFAETAPGGVFSGDYEENSWTPVLQGSTTAGAFTYTVQLGRYERRGRVVTFRGKVLISAIGSAPVGNTVIGGLPYNSANVNIQQPIDIGKAKFNLATAGAWLVGQITNNTKNISLFEDIDNATAINLASATGVLADSEITFSGTYEISLA
jgi:hypothetical protein